MQKTQLKSILVHPDIHTYIHTYIHTCTYMYILYIHVRTYMYINAYLRADPHIHSKQLEPTHTEYIVEKIQYTGKQMVKV